MPEDFCSERYWSQYTRYLNRLYHILMAEKDRLGRCLTYHEYWNGKEATKLRLYKLHVYTKLINAVQHDALAVNENTDDDEWLD